MAMLSPRSACVYKILVILVTTASLLSIWKYSETESFYSRELKRGGIAFLERVHTPTVDEPPSRSIRRPSVRPNAFHQKAPSQETLDALFNFVPNYDRVGRIDPLWLCSDYVIRPREREKKLIFLHVKRAGGTTVRALLRAYAYMCHASFVTIGRCENLGREFLDGEENWSNLYGSVPNAGRPCLLSWSENRSGHVLSEGRGRVSTDFLMKNEIDIVSGTVPYGCDESWQNKDGKQVEAQYVVLLRDPLTKYVSEFLYEHRMKNLTVSESVPLIRRKIQEEAANGTYHNVYSKFLITPAQKSWMAFERVPWTNERKLNLSLSNMVNQNMIVTIMEKMPQSFVLLQYLLDGVREVPSIFQYFANMDKINEPLGINYMNQTRGVLAALRSDKELMRVLRELLKYEQTIYDWGVRVHEAQLEHVMSLGWPRTIEP
jgi:Sulfotransferase family